MEIVNQHLTRQMDIIPVHTLAIPVNVIGCGAIGSFTVLALAKMGVTNIQVWDDDEVSVENMSNQFFRFKDIGTNKALALAQLVDDFTGVKIKAHPYRFEPNVAGLQGVVVSAVDSMAARAMIHRTLTVACPGVRLLVDPRMSAELYLQFTCSPKRDAWYTKTLYSDTEAVAERCTAKATVYTATLAAGMVVKTIKNFITGEDYPKDISWNIKASENPMDMFAHKQTTMKEVRNACM